MIFVTIIDQKQEGYKKRCVRMADFLMKECEKEESSVEIFLVGNEQMPKNVLSFPADTSFPRPDLTKPSLGEIHLNPTYIKEHGEDFDYMLTHGFLHLLGYDHIKKNDRMKMEKREIELLKKFNLATDKS